MFARTALSALLLFLSALLEPQTAGAAERVSRTLVLEGELTRADHQTYRELAFEVPAGVERINVSFSYDRENRTVVDLGLYDPNGFRGWSGGNKASFTIATADATPSYVPGPIVAGVWRLLLGVPNIREGSSARYRAEIRLDPIDAPAPASAFFNGPLRPEPGWRRGDFHTHTGHSDGSCDSLAGRRVPCPAFRTLEAARRAGLDFVAVTDHNTASQNASLRELQAYYDTLLIIPGQEITTFFGHMNVFGTTGPLEFQLGDPRLPRIDALLEAVRAQGGIASVNHPGMPSGEACMGCGWIVKDMDAAMLGAVEIANGGTMHLTGAADGQLSHIPYWQSLLDRGYRVTGIGGSDSHDPDAPINKQFPVGRPATVVFADNLSQRAILDGLRAGRAFVDLSGSKDRMVDLTISSKEGRAVMGSIARVGRGERATLAIDVRGAAGGRVELVAGAAAPQLEARALPVASDRETLTFRLPAAGRNAWWIRVDVRSADGRLILLSNPIYLKSK
jgi:hypothetical protein